MEKSSSTPTVLDCCKKKRWAQHFQPTNETKSGQHQHFLTVGSKKTVWPNTFGQQKRNRSPQMMLMIIMIMIDM